MQVHKADLIRMLDSYRVAHALIGGMLTERQVNTRMTLYTLTPETLRPTQITLEVLSEFNDVLNTLYNSAVTGDLDLLENLNLTILPDKESADG